MISERLVRRWFQHFKSSILEDEKEQDHSSDFDDQALLQEAKDKSLMIRKLVQQFDIDYSTIVGQLKMLGKE